MKNNYKIIIYFILGCISINKTLAQTWSTLGTGINFPFFPGSVNALTDYTGELYAGGRFDYADGNVTKNIAKWDGTNWLPLDSGVNGDVLDLAVYKNELYVSGSFTSAGGISVHLIAKWNGASWSSVGTGIKGGHSINALEVFNGELYAAGQFDTAGNIPTQNIAKWNGSTWSPVDTGIGGLILSLATYNGELYAGGIFYVSKWNGISWSNINIGSAYHIIDNIRAMTEYKNELCVAGSFDSIGLIRANNIAKWDGVNWTSLNSGTSHLSHETVSALTLYNNELYMGGFFTDAGGNHASNIAKWNGINWSPLGNGVNADVAALTNFNGDLFVGGSFSTAGNISANSIAKWNLPIGINEIHFSNSVNIFPNPTTDKIIIENDRGYSNYELYDFTGKLLIKDVFSNLKLELDFRNFSKGLYFLNINQAGKEIHQKIIKN